jgi:uncharacterized membrane protein YedE/YeeE
MEWLIETYGTGTIIVALGLLVGIVFGAAAQYSKFCLRAATIELATVTPGPRLAVWLVAFSSAVAAVQLSILLGWLSVVDARQLASVGSMSGAIIGGLMFGVGMILARGCASRLLVLSATGNLRALITGLVLTIVAQASLTGVLSPVREALAGLWQVSGGTGRDLLALLGLSTGFAATVATVVLLVSVGFALRAGVSKGATLAAVLVGLAVAGGWVGTYAISRNSFDVVAITSVTFTGPSTDTLMGFVSVSQMPLSFGIGLVPGVFVGSAAMAIFTGTWHIQRFGPDAPMESYLVGAVLMGFGSMLAGGCAVGAGMSGGAIFATTAWVAVFCMWIGAMVTHHLTRATRIRDVPA